MALPVEIMKCYSAAAHLEVDRIPYLYGGGHPNFGSVKDPCKGYDCSSWCSVQLHEGGILGSNISLDTEEFLYWGIPGIGAYMTLWVINQQELKHCFIQYNIRPHPPIYSVAAHTGTICGWSYNQITNGYTPRRRK